MLSLPPSGCEQLIQNALTPPFHYPPPRPFPTVNLEPELNKHIKRIHSAQAADELWHLLQPFFYATHTHTRTRTSGPWNVCGQVCCCHPNVSSSPRHGTFRSNQQIRPSSPPATVFLLQLQDTAGGSVGNMVDVCPF